MARKASTLHKDQIIPLIIAEAKRIIDPDDFDDYEEMVAEKRDFAFGMLLSFMAYESHTLKKDLKVSFDWENYSDGDDWVLSPNGFWYLKMFAGGDWEAPVSFIIYWDGSNTRAYVPTNGNVFNRKSKTAYGNDNASDTLDIIQVYGANSKEALDDFYNIQGDWALMTVDIDKRIST